MSKLARIMVADDHPLLRTGIIETIARHPGCTVVGEASNFADACQLAAELRPCIALLDVAMPGDTFLAVRTILSQSPNTKVVMLTASAAEDDLLNSLKSGAKGYILKGTGGAELLRVLMSIIDGGAYVPPELATSALLNNKNRRSVPIEALTSREDAVLSSVAMGLTNKEIAIKLCMAEKTVKHYMTKIMEKLQARNRVEAAMIARERNPGSYPGLNGHRHSGHV